MSRSRRWVALFRAVNLGSHGKLAMADLRDMAAALGLQDPVTVLQTGNLVFDAAEPEAELERKIEAAAAARLSLRTDVMVRDKEAWDAVIAGNPFAAAARTDPAHLVLLVLKGDPSPDARAALEAAIIGREEVRVAARSAYAIFPDGIGRSKLTMRVLERHLGVRATGRNWRTVAKIAEALAA